MPNTVSVKLYKTKFCTSFTLTHKQSFLTNVVCQRITFGFACQACLTKPGCCKTTFCNVVSFAKLYFILILCIGVKHPIPFRTRIVNPPIAKLYCLTREKWLESRIGKIKLCNKSTENAKLVTCKTTFCNNQVLSSLLDTQNVVIHKLRLCKQRQALHDKRSL